MADDLSRRELVKKTALLVCVPAAASLAEGCAVRVDTEREVPVQPPVRGVLKVALADVPELQKKGGAVQLRPDSSTWVLVAVEDLYDVPV